MSTASRLLIDEQPLQALPSLACEIGLNKAVFVQQVHYWIQKDSAHVRDGRRWVYNTYEGWSEQFPFWSSEVIRKRIVKPLEEAGILLTTQHYNQMPQDKTKWYSIDYDALNALLVPPDEATSLTVDPPDKIPAQTGRNDHPKTGQNDHTVNQRLPETNDRDSTLQAGDRPNGAGPPKKDKVISSKQYGIGRLVDLAKEAKLRGKKPAPLDEHYKRRHGSVYEAYLRDGYEVDGLEPALEYLVAAACGEGVGWLKGKHRWIPLVDAVAHVEGDDSATLDPDEPMNPHSEAALAARDKPRSIAWYYAAYEDAIQFDLAVWIEEGLTHTEIIEKIENLGRTLERVKRGEHCGA